uniref:RNA polymerase beta' subunit n=1 Tax=Tetraena simplex TaxID=2499693 RepID=UPI002237596A|nr:RNA polymerase beta' subunit [Tetraena simplex]UYC29894.1 RNA polymerase beta' subunit [Tetraena simplex]
MIDQYKHQQLRIGSVSSQKISAWATKILPNGEIVGEVTKPYTFHYKTNKPEKDGLFCERIFGPIKSGICACGNYRVIGTEKEEKKFCEQCGVEFVDSRVRRYQMGYIKLACPVTHVWYLKRLPSYIANLLDKPLKELEGLVYCDIFILLGPKLKNRLSYDYEVYSNMKSNPGNTAFHFFLLPKVLIHFEIEKFRPEQVLFANNKPIEIYDLLETLHWLNGKNWEKKVPQVMNGKTEKVEEEKIFWLDVSNELNISFEQTKNQNGWFYVYYLFFPLSRDQSFRKMEVNKGVPILMNSIEESSIGTILLLIYYQQVDLRRENKKCVRRNWCKKPKIHFLIMESVDNQRGMVIIKFTSHFQMKLRAKRDDFVRLYLVNGSTIQDVLSLSKVPHFHYINVDCLAKEQESFSRHLKFAVKLDSILLRTEELLRVKFANKNLLYGKYFRKLCKVILYCKIERPPCIGEAYRRSNLFEWKGAQFVYIHEFVRDSMQTLMGIKWLFMYLYLWRLKQRPVYLCFLIGIFCLQLLGIPFRYQLKICLLGSMYKQVVILEVFVQIGIIRGIIETLEKKEWTIISARKKKNLFFCNSYDAIGAYQQKRIKLDSPLWLRWKLDQRVIASREAPIEVHYESLGTYREIYGHYLIVRSIKKEILWMYIRTDVGHISLYREIEEAIQGFCRADS